MFDRDGDDMEGLRFGPAACMALMGSFGITEMIDDACEWDRKQRVMSPGNVVKAVAGMMFTENIKQAMHNVSLFYSNAPKDSLFGPKATEDSLNDSALGRGLETVFRADTEKLFYSVCARTKALIGLCPGMFNFDPTNVTIARTAGDEYEKLPEGAPVPKLGYPKDGTTGRVQYNISCATDNYGMPAYIKAYDGNTDDTVMISDAVRFVENAMEDRRIIAVGDSKMTHWELVDHMCSHGTHFVSKPPENFAGYVRQKVVDKALGNKFTPVGAIGGRRDSPEFEVYDTSMKCNGRTLRFIVYRRTDRSKTVRHMKRVENMMLKKAFSHLEAMIFETEEKARAEYRGTIGKLGIKAYDLVPTFRSRRSLKYQNGEEWKAAFKFSYNEKKAEDAASKDVGVLITSLPHSDETNDDPTFGATAYDVMRIYFGQWKIENLFGTMKSGMGADDVFFQNPQRESVMLFIIAVAALIRNIVKMRLRSEQGKAFGIPANMTAERMFLLVQNVFVEYDRAGRRIRLKGSPKDRAMALAFLDLLGIDPNKLLG